MSEKNYQGIDGLRAYSAIGIILMHVLSNGAYELNGFLFDKVILSFTNLVFLFMMISGFSMCCGYYNKIINSEISWDYFYSKRYKRIWPYFAILCLLDFVMSPSIESFYEVFANLTLCFGLLPNVNISVIGVGWFLGVVFVFYMVFPFFCYLLSSKKRAWLSFMLALIFNMICNDYFDVGRTNIIYCAVFFLAGGLVFLYKDKLENAKTPLFWGTMCIICVLIYYVIGANVPIMLCLFSTMLIWGINIKKTGLLKNSITRFLSGISMELYLSHMVIYRVLEKIKLLHFFESELLSYLFMSVGTIIGTIVFSVIIKLILNRIETFMKNRTVK